MMMMAVSSLARIVGRSEFSKKYINYDPSRLRSLLKVEISWRTPIPLFRPGDIPQWHRQAETAVATTRLYSCTQEEMRI
jgi:hypothetical protein